MLIAWLKSPDVMIPEPLSLDNETARRDRVLLILRRPCIGSHFLSNLIQHRERLTLGVQRLAGLAEVIVIVADLDAFVVLGDCRQIQNSPAAARFHQRADKIVGMQALHDDNNRSGLLVIETRQDRVAEQLVVRLALDVRPHVLRLDWIVTDNDIAAAARYGAGG